MAKPTLTSRLLGKADYDYIVGVIDKWWGGPTTALAHPIFYYELGELARVVEADGRVVGFLLGFIAPRASDAGRGPVGYVHLVGIDPDFRRQAVGTLLYRSFEDACRRAGCTLLKAITTLGNDGSVRFHEALGWGTATVDDYAGTGRSRLVFTKPLAP